jgi:hypothetical protein
LRSHPSQWQRTRPLVSPFDPYAVSSVPYPQYATPAAGCQQQKNIGTAGLKSTDRGLASWSIIVHDPAANNRPRANTYAPNRDAQLPALEINGTRWPRIFELAYQKYKELRDSRGNIACHLICCAGRRCSVGQPPGETTQTRVPTCDLFSLVIGTGKACV